MSVSGKYMTCKIGTVEIFDNYAWDATEGGDVLERTCARHGGYEFEDLGVFNCHISIKGYMDILAGQYAEVRRGMEIADLRLLRRASDTVPAFIIPYAIVVNSRQGGEVKGKVEWNCEVHSQGPYQYADPGGTLKEVGTDEADNSQADPERAARAAKNADPAPDKPAKSKPAPAKATTPGDKE